MERRDLRIGCDFVYVADIPTPTVLQVQPWADPAIEIRDVQWQLDPGVPTTTYTDLYGNTCTRLTLPAGRSTIHYEAIATVPDATEEIDFAAPEIPAEQLPDDVLLYTVGSRYCLPDVLGHRTWQLFENVPPGYGRVQAICDYVHNYLRFQYGSSRPTSTAADVYLAGRGVCRDFAHLLITMCRALNIPARYAFGYLPFLDVSSNGDPADFAAWVEVWLGDRWWTFDPRNNSGRKGRVVIGRGRDAADVAMATTFGGPWLQSMIVFADELPTQA